MCGKGDMRLLSWSCELHLLEVLERQTAAVWHLKPPPEIPIPVEAACHSVPARQPHRHTLMGVHLTVPNTAVLRGNPTDVPPNSEGDENSRHLTYA